MWICAFIVTSRRVDITHKKESIALGTEHLKPDNGGNIVIVAEDLMNDIENVLNRDLSREYHQDDKMSKSVLFVQES
jgi:hypothetical protein